MWQCGLFDRARPASLVPFLLKERAFVMRTVFPRIDLARPTAEVALAWGRGHLGIADKLCRASRSGRPLRWRVETIRLRVHSADCN